MPDFLKFSPQLTHIRTVRINAPHSTNLNPNEHLHNDRSKKPPKPFNSNPTLGRRRIAAKTSAHKKRTTSPKFTMNHSCGVGPVGFILIPSVPEASPAPPSKLRGAAPSVAAGNYDAGPAKGQGVQIRPTPRTGPSIH